MEVVVVGAGLYGLTMAERFANAGIKVLLVDKRKSLGGNAATTIDTKTGIEIHTYGSHIFHTNSERVFKYISKFTNLTNYQHHVFTTHDKKVFAMPINLATINQFYGETFSPAEAEAKIKSEPIPFPGAPVIGKPLFDAFIKNYTAKQWQKPAEDLPKEIFARLPIRFNYNTRYFDAKYEGMPADGYSKWFENMVANPNISLKLGTTFDATDICKLANSGKLVIYTGPIDEFYKYEFGELEWRSLKFEVEKKSVRDWQGCAVMNYADLDVSYTRIHEFKHYHPEKDFGDNTIIMTEYPATWTPGDEPYYPVRRAEDLEKLEKYIAKAKQEKNIIFGGRLGSYQYFDMDATILAALEKFDELKRKIDEK